MFAATTEPMLLRAAVADAPGCGKDPAGPPALLICGEVSAEDKLGPSSPGLDYKERKMQMVRAMEVLWDYDPTMGWGVYLLK